MKNNYIHIILFALVSLCSWQSLAQVNKVRFVDQNEQPLVNLVLEVTLKTEQSLAESSSHIMDQVDKAFKPELLLIKKGDDVSFPNSDNIRHHVYSFSQAKPFELKLYSGRPTNPMTFEQHGVVTLGCNIHDSMVGFIYVANSPQAFVSNQNGEIELSNIDQVTQMTSWHARQKSSPEMPQKLDLNRLKPGAITTYTIETVPPEKRDTFGAKFNDAQ